MNKYHFNETFLKEKIEEGKLVLKTYDSDSQIYKSAGMMIRSFEEFLNEKTINFYDDNSIEEKLNRINHSLNINLNLVTLDEWKKLKELCECMPKMNFKKCNSKCLSTNNSNVVKEVLNFYKDLDTNIYEAILAIFEHEYKLVNINPKNSNTDLSFGCDYLSLPFVNVSAKNDMKYIVLAHELRHAANYYLNPQNESLYGELSSIYSEILFTDKLNSKDKNCYPLYNERINYTCQIMKELIGYINFLEKYDKYGRKLTLRNYKYILNVNNEDLLFAKAEVLIKQKYMIIYDYIMSLLYAIKLREKYYNGDKKAINEELRNILIGQKIDFNYEKLGDKFIDYVKYVKKLNYR